MPATIRLGSTGDDVKRLQRALARIQQWSPFGPISGEFDASLQTAVVAYQKNSALTPDGVVGPLTWAKLPSYREASPTLQVGASGPVVLWLQQLLAQSGARFGSYPGALDGLFGPSTLAAVKLLQKWGGAPVTGVVDDATWFIWWEPGAANQLTIEAACGLTANIPPPA